MTGRHPSHQPALSPLLARRSFLPLFITQFLGAFNGNLFKNAAIVLILYRLGSEQESGGKVLATLALALFVLPFFLFSATAGQIADRFDKTRVIQASKLLELAAAVVAAIALAWGAPAMLLTALFLLGAQAALFGPLKYGILPELLAENDLLGANGLIEAATFLAILAGTIMGSLTVLGTDGVLIIQSTVIVAAAAGWIASLAIPPTQAKAPGLSLDWNFPRLTWSLLRETSGPSSLLGLIMGVSWFWLAGATYLTQFPAFAKDALHAGPDVVSLFLGMFSLGICAGSLLCQRLFRGRASLRLAPYGLLAMAVFGLDFVLSAQPLGNIDGDFAGIADFLAVPQSWHLLADLLAIAIASAIYVVPLYTLLQQRAAPSHRARVIAANNVMNALFMTVAAGLAAMLLGTGLGIKGLLGGMAAANIAVAALFYRWKSA
ncbi:MFS transporter [Telmatospirillum siberiense]|uniref:MFS transporter n=1 Tax=Telmatospirillum siberiense TaxID=382514 RepID=A0A2N3PZU9_9PROT|nr:MFS transporter [Telmatospirillum siberiense]PKU25919.1 MFS transporter [Telmatospirillum siberiense]